MMLNELLKLMKFLIVVIHHVFPLLVGSLELMNVCLFALGISEILVCCPHTLQAVACRSVITFYSHEIIWKGKHFVQCNALAVAGCKQFVGIVVLLMTHFLAATIDNHV